MRRDARVCAIGILVLLAAVSCGDGRPNVTVERMDVALTVLVDGSIQIDERLTVRFGEAPVSAFRRQTPVWRHDGVFDVSAAMDGRSFAKGPGPGQLQVGKGPGLDVRWTFPPAAASVHTFALTYRAANAVSLSGIRGTVSWRAVPARRDFDVSAASMTLTLPDSAVLLQDPWMEEPGWTVARQPHGMTATRASVPRGDAATIGIEFTVDGMAASTPQWQLDEDLLAEYIPAFIAAGLFILVIGAGVWWMLRFKYPPLPATGGEATTGDGSTTDVDRLGITPAMRLAIMRGRSQGNRAECRAAIDGLVASGAVTTDGDRIRLAHAEMARTTHEQVITHELWLRKGEGLSRSAIESARIRRHVRRALTADLVSAGLADAERVLAARDLRRTGVAVAVFGFAAWAAVSIAMRQFGAWPLIVPWSILLIGVFFTIGAARFHVLSDAGAKVRVLYFARVLDGRN